MPEISVIICTHNPRVEFLSRVLASLKAQTMPQHLWELLLIDNASKQPLSSAWDLSWHAQARHIREEELGLTPARLRGIKESNGKIIVFVDDDNVMRPDFLANTMSISTEYPFLGAWGGTVEGEFEQPLPDWLKPHLSALAVRRVERDCWSNYYADNRSMPFGAGLCVRQPIAAAHAQAITARPASKNLGRKGASLVSGEDIDLALTAYDRGFGTGLFSRLHITHIIPKSRMTVEYLCRLLEGIEYSTHMLRYLRNPDYVPPRMPALNQWLRAFQVWRLPEPIRSIAQSEHRGLDKAILEISSKA
jgi:GT2 family glycosyltransferase